VAAIKILEVLYCKSAIKMDFNIYVKPNILNMSIRESGLRQRKWRWGINVEKTCMSTKIAKD
jgi:hypothetical protein